MTTFFFGVSEANFGNLIICVNGTFSVFLPETTHQRGILYVQGKRYKDTESIIPLHVSSKNNIYICLFTFYLLHKICSSLTKEFPDDLFFFSE
jgi:hypothetical protein